MPPSLRGKMGYNGAKVLGNIFLLSPQCGGSAGVIYTPVEFAVTQSGAKSGAITIRVALQNKKFLAPLFPVGVCVCVCVCVFVCV